MFSIEKRALIIGVAVLGFGAFAAAPASAQATRTWISGVGDDVNPCSRTAPCRTFAGAISKTAAHGEINCIDPLSGGAVTITKSITIMCDEVEAGILVGGSAAITINAGDTDVVTLSGLDIAGVAPSTPGTNGINFINGAGLNIRNTTIRGFGTQAISFNPNTGDTSFLNLDNVIVHQSGTAGNPATSAIKVAPLNNATANVVITNTLVQNNVNMGLRLDLTGTTGTRINAQVTDSAFNDSTVGMLIKAPAGTGTINATVTNTVISNNATLGVFGNGSGVTARFSTTTISGNGVGSAGAATGVSAANASLLQSYGNNYLNGNFNSAGTETNGAFSGPVVLK